MEPNGNSTLINDNMEEDNLENLNAIEPNLAKKMTVPKRQRQNNQFLREFTKEYADLKKKTDRRRYQCKIDEKTNVSIGIKLL